MFAACNHIVDDKEQHQTHQQQKQQQQNQCNLSVMMGVFPGIYCRKISHYYYLIVNAKQKHNNLIRCCQGLHLKRRKKRTRHD